MNLVEIAILKQPPVKKGNCYYHRDYKILSKSKLTTEQITSLRYIGLLGGGQNYSISFSNSRNSYQGSLFYEAIVTDQIDSSG